MKFDLLIRNGTIVLPTTGLTEASVGARDGKVAAILATGEIADGAEEIDARGKIVFSGVIDPHMHIGLGQGLPDWETETRSAVMGGVTTGCNFLMHGQSYFPIVQENLAAAQKSSYIDFAFHLVPSAPEHLEEMPEYRRRFGICSFKYLTSFRGSEGAYLGVQGTDDGYMYRCLQIVAEMGEGMFCVHPENIEVVWELRRQLQAAGRDDLKAWDDSRPQVVEAEATYSVALYAQAVACPLYIVHVSGGMVLEEARRAKEKASRAPLYIETCPHYLTHTSDDPLGPLGKVNPPLRSRADIDALWEGIASGLVDTVGSDHCARGRERKKGSIWTSSAGFPGTATVLPVVLSEGVHRRGLSLSRVAQLTSYNTARIFGLYPRKGVIAPGSDADFAIVDLDKEQTVTPALLQSYADYSLYEGWKLKGWPVATIVRGQVVMRDGAIVGHPGVAQYIRGESRPLPGKVIY